MARVRFVDTLRLLATNDVEFIVVGMTAGILQGVPLTTLDVDVLHRRTPENVERLLRVLREIEATYRHDPRKLSPGASHLMGPGHQLLVTTYGDLDCLGSIGDGKTYDDLIQSTTAVDLADGVQVRVLELGTLTAMKREAGRPKDLAALPVLEATLAERDRPR